MPNSSTIIPTLTDLLAILSVSACTMTAPTLPVLDHVATNVATTAPLDWEKGHPERADWSAGLRQTFAAHLDQIGTPADIAAYCPAYPTLPPAGKAEALSVMAVAIARRESGYDPTQVFHEPPPLGVDSIGLFQLSYEDGYSWCVLDKAHDSLKDPLNNITCAVGEMSALIHRDGVIASGASVSGGKGLSKYWSVMQDGSGHFKQEIQNRVMSLPSCAG